MKATCWMGKQNVEVRDVPDPQILNQRDAIVKITVDGDLRLGPAPLQRVHADDEERRRPRPRVHGRSGRGRPSGQEAEGRRRVVVPFTIACGNCWQCRHENWSLCENSNPERRARREADGARGVGRVRVLAPAPAGSPAARPSLRACRSPTSARSRSRMASTTSRCCSCPTSSRPATWPPRCATSSRATRSRCGAAARSVCSRSRVRTCSAPSG